MSVDPRQVREALRDAEAAFSTAEANYVYAKKVLERLRTLVKALPPQQVPAKPAHRPRERLLTREQELALVRYAAVYPEAGTQRLADHIDGTQYAVRRFKREHPDFFPAAGEKPERSGEKWDDAAGSALDFAGES